MICYINPIKQGKQIHFWSSNSHDIILFLGSHENPPLPKKSSASEKNTWNHDKSSCRSCPFVKLHEITMFAAKTPWTSPCFLVKSSFHPIKSRFFKPWNHPFHHHQLPSNPMENHELTTFQTGELPIYPIYAPLQGPHGESNPRPGGSRSSRRNSGFFVVTC